MSDLPVPDETRIALRVLLDAVHKLRDGAGAPILRALREHNGTTEAEEPWPLSPLDSALTADGECPECPTGTVQYVGRVEWETGHQPYACDAGCGYCG